MIIATDPKAVNTAGITAKKEFTVKAGAHIMSVLSGLYTSPAKAMVREYMTNMYDAWIALKRQNPSASYIPAEVHAPSRLTPVLTFKDYGIGMDYDTVFNVYTSYGSSTKNEDNEQVGGFGLGSKSAFCYNDGQQWTIESRHGGKKMTFMAYISPDGIPTLAHVGTVDTDEHSGVTISIPIRRDDVEKVQDAIKLYAPFFPMPLKVENTIVPKLPEPLLQSDDWAIYAPEFPINNDGVIVVMGNVPYVLGWHDMREIASKHKNVYTWPRSPLVLQVPIGSVDITPSRDSLKMTPKTVEYLARRGEEVHLALPLVIERTVATLPTEYAKKKAVVALSSLTSLNNLNIRPTITRPSADVKQTFGHDPITYSITESHLSTPEVGTPQDINLKLNAEHFIVVNDVSRGADKIVRGFVRREMVNTNANNRAYTWGHKVGTVLMLTTSKSVQEISDFFGGFPLEKIYLASALAGTVPTIRDTRTPKAKNHPIPYKFNDGSWQKRATLPTSGFYVPLKKYGRRGANIDIQGVDTTFIAEAVTILNQHLGVKVDTVYGFMSDELAKKPLDKSWVPLTEVLTKALKEFVQKNPDQAALVLYDRQRQGRGTRMMLSIADQLDKDGIQVDPFAKLHAEYQQVLGTPQWNMSYSLYHFVKNAFGSLLMPLQGPMQEIRDQYPMLRMVVEMAENTYMDEKAFVTKYYPVVKDYIKV